MAKPRKIIPKQRLIEYLEAGYTLDEIAHEFHKSRTYISNLLDFHEIKAEQIPGRKYAMKKRRKMLENRDFVTVMYEQIKRQKK